MSTSIAEGSSLVQPVDEEGVASREPFGRSPDLVCEVNGLLVDQELLELERHLPLQKKRVESRTVDRVEKIADVWRVKAMGLESLSRRSSSPVLLLSSLLSIFWGLPDHVVGECDYVRPELLRSRRTNRLRVMICSSGSTMR